MSVSRRSRGGKQGGVKEEKKSNGGRGREEKGRLKKEQRERSRGRGAEGEECKFSGLFYLLSVLCPVLSLLWS